MIEKRVVISKDALAGPLLGPAARHPESNLENDNLRYYLGKLWRNDPGEQGEQTPVTSPVMWSDHPNPVSQYLAQHVEPPRIIHYQPTWHQPTPDNWYSKYGKITQNFRLSFSSKSLHDHGFRPPGPAQVDRLAAIEEFLGSHDPEPTIAAFLEERFGLKSRQGDPDSELRKYTDEVFELPLFLSQDKVLENNIRSSAPVATTIPRYNYPSLEYEAEASKLRPAFNNLIPNIYALLLEIQNLDVNDATRDSLLELVTLRGRIPRDKVNSTNWYYNEWAKYIQNPINAFREINDKFNNIIIPPSGMKLINDLGMNNNFAPISVDIQFGTPGSKVFANLLNDTKLSSTLMVALSTSYGTTSRGTGLARPVLIAEHGDSQIVGIPQYGTYNRQYTPTPGMPEWSYDQRGYVTLDLLNWWFGPPPVQLPESGLNVGRRVGEGEEGSGEGEEGSGEVEVLPAGTGLMGDAEEDPPAHAFQERQGIFESAARLEMLVGDFVGNSAIILGQGGEEDIITSDSPEHAFYRNLLKARFESKLKRLIRRHLRSFEEVLDGKKSHSETAFYIIEKQLPLERLATQQRICVSNLDEAVRYVDTQVKYGRGADQEFNEIRNSYRYVIYAAQMVIGSEYEYELTDDGVSIDSEWSEWEGGLRHKITSANALCTSTVRPTVKLINVPVFDSLELSVLDKPPLPPNVDIIPYRSLDDRILINLEAQNGSQRMVPHPIEPADRGSFNDALYVQSLQTGELLDDVMTNGQIFGSDDPVKGFEVYRTEFRPTSYEDFSGFLRVSKTVRGKPGQKDSNATSVRDRIRPNRKYYYTFRAIDVHRHVSNPSPVYEVEMVNDGGTIYPVIKIIDFQEGEKMTRSPQKSFKKHIKIFPNFMQKVIDEEGSELFGLVDGGDRWIFGLVDSPIGKDIKLGIQEESVWNKQFKVRFISKKTGRKFDINMKFKTEQNDLTEVDDER